MDATHNPGDHQTTEGQPTDPVGEEKVLCFVSKRQVAQSRARQVRHPKEGLVWVAEEFLR